MKHQNTKLQQLLELANNYPSPHNGQPIQLTSPGPDNLQVYFQTKRGLRATPISYLFSFVSIGVFIRHLELSAQALGHTCKVHLQLPKQAAMAGAGNLLCAKVTVGWDAVPADKVLETALRQRQTSRKQYQQGVSAGEQQQLITLAAAEKVKLAFVGPAVAQQVIWLNQRAVFDDMFDPAVRHELRHWMRFNQAEKVAQHDGLSYDCMEMSGAAMRFGVDHYKVLRAPVIAPLLRQYYLRTMRDDSSVGYITAPFTSEQQAYQIGRYIIDMWIELTKKGHYLHPFGTIVSNQQAHTDFCKLVDLPAEDRQTSYVVFIFRAGASSKPVQSERLPIAKHLYNQA